VIDGETVVTSALTMSVIDVVAAARSRYQIGHRWFVAGGGKPAAFLRCSEGREWHLADIPIAPANVRYWSNSGQTYILARDRLSANDPLRTCCAADTPGNKRSYPSAATDRSIDPKAARLLTLPILSGGGHAWVFPAWCFEFHIIGNFEKSAYGDGPM
jgi:hypothetical protein